MPGCEVQLKGSFNLNTTNRSGFDQRLGGQLACYRKTIRREALAVINPVTPGPRSLLVWSAPALEGARANLRHTHHADAIRWVLDSSDQRVDYPPVRHESEPLRAVTSGRQALEQLVDG